MGKRTQRPRLQNKKDKAGCIGGLISIFDFQNGRSTRKLLSDKRHGATHSDGAGHSRSKIDVLIDSDENSQSSDANEENTKVTASADKPPSVKILILEEMYNEKDPKKTSEVEAKLYNPESGGHVRKSKKKTKKTSKRTRSFQQKLEGDLRSYLNIDAIIDEFGGQIDEKDLTAVGHYQRDELLQSKQQISISEENLSEAAKVFITQNFINGKNLAANETQPAKEFLDALQTLISNKELLLKLLQDPNSLLVKRVQCLLDSQAEKDKSPVSPMEPNMLVQESSSLRPSEELVSRKQLNFFRRKKIKSHDKRLPEHASSVQDLSKIVILKPGPVGLQGSEIETSPRLLQSHYISRNKPIEKAASPFSLAEIKRKFKHAVSKDRHGISMSDKNSKISADNRNAEDGFKGINGESFGRKSPNRNHFFNERFPKSSIGSKNEDKKGISKEFQEPVASRYPERLVSNIYTEAKKHLSEMLNDGDENEDFLSRPDPESLGRILALTEYKLSPTSSPGRELDPGLKSAQTRVSPHEQSSRVNENAWQFRKDKSGWVCPSVQSMESQSSIPDGSPDEKMEALSLSSSYQKLPDEVISDDEAERTSSFAGIMSSSEVDVENVERTKSVIHEETKVFEACPEPSSPCINESEQNEAVDCVISNWNTPDGAIHEDKVKRTSTCGESENCSQVDLDIVLTTSITQEECNDLKDFSESTVSCTIRNEHHDDTAQSCDEENFCKSLKLDLDEELLPSSSPLASPSDSPTAVKIEHLESFTERPERPSPVSVLEPLFSDDDISPASSRVYTVELPIQPLQIRFEEQDSYDLGHGSHVKCGLGDKESIFEYIKAVLQASNLSVGDILLRSPSSHQLLDPSLLQEVQLFSNRICYDQKLLFDCINEVLLEVFEQYFACSPWAAFVKPNIRPVPNAKNLIYEIWKGVYFHLLPVQAPCTLDQILRKDMTRSGMWMDLRLDAESIGSEMGEVIMDEMIEDTIWSCINDREWAVAPELTEEGSNIKL